VLRAFDRGLRWIVTFGAWLALPLALLLFAQWPLREVVQAGSRYANDLAQILFALYVSIGITAATREDAHLAVDVVARGYVPRIRRVLLIAATLLAVVPWSSFVLYAAWPGIVQSVRQLERFPDTYNSGYFMLRVAVGVLALLALVQALLTVLRPGEHKE
jgi:TRAP-type C4-dicarboxylate transport system permease small subunit